MTKLLYAFLLFVTALSPASCARDRDATPAVAQASGCVAFSPGGDQPKVAAPMAGRLTRICYRSYAVGFSGLSGTPLWSAERLTRASVLAARQLERTGEFFEDRNIPGSDRSHLSDFRGSGFDRGHMAPSGDMPTQEAQQESFSLANMVPQDRGLNRYLWADVESAVRDLAVREGAIFVVTGPAFDHGDRLTALRGRVLVPSAVFKAVYVPGKGAAAYLADNDATPRLRFMSIGDLEDRTGVNAFPALSKAERVNRLWLPSVRSSSPQPGFAS